MPNGRTHAAISISNLVAVAAVGAPVVWNQHDRLPAYAAVLAGLTIGLLVTPDLDMKQITLEERRALRVPVLGWLWVLLWWPYAALLPHRSPVSHWPVIGMLLRAAWLALIVVMADWLIQPQGIALDPARWKLALYVLMAWGVQDLYHYLADKLIRGKRK